MVLMLVFLFCNTSTLIIWHRNSCWWDGFYNLVQTLSILFYFYTVRYPIVLSSGRYFWMRFSRSGWDLAEWVERLAVNDKVATVLGLIPASSDSVAANNILYRNLMTCVRPTMDHHRKPVAHSNLWKNNSTLRRHHTAVFCSTLFSSSPSLIINNAAIHFHQHFRYITVNCRGFRQLRFYPLLCVVNLSLAVIRIILIQLF